MKKKAMSAVLMMSMVIGSGLTVCAAPEIMADGTVFDAEYYSDTYSDLKEAFGNDATALYNHYIQYGRAEGRQASGSISSVTDLTDSEILDMYDWDYMGYCGGDTSANRVDIVFQASSNWEPETIYMYDNAQYAIDIDTGTLFIYGNGTIWDKDQTWPWMYYIQYESSNYRDDTSISGRIAYLYENDIYMKYLIRHVIIGHNISDLPLFLIPDYTTDVTIFGPMESIDSFAFRGCEVLQTVRIPKETKIRERHGYDYFVVGSYFSPATFAVIRY